MEGQVTKNQNYDKGPLKTVAETPETVVTIDGQPDGTADLGRDEIEVTGKTKSLMDDKTDGLWTLSEQEIPCRRQKSTKGQAK